MKKKGFTLIELLVVIAIIAMLLAILMPALNKVKRLAQRLVCGTSCKGLGTAMMVYAQDFEDEYPIQGGNGNHRWSEVGRTWEWWNPDKYWSNPQGKYLTVASSLYLLVRVADVDPKSFVCRSGDEKAFKGVGGSANVDMVELWDFGGDDITTTVDGESLVYNDGYPRKHVSYSYQLPYASGPVPAHPASATASASTAILADKNPWCDPKLTSAVGMNDADKKRDYLMLIDFLGAGDTTVWTDTDNPLRDSTTAWQVQIANSQPHGREGQNVLFGDGHASFEKRPDISYQNDNIYTQFGGWAPYSEEAKRVGAVLPRTDPDPLPFDALYPKNAEDTVLVNDDSRDAAAHGFPQ